MTAAEFQTWMGAFLGTVLVGLVVYICVVKQEITGNALIMAAIGLAFAGLTYWSLISLPGGIRLEAREAVKRAEDSAKRAEKAAEESLGAAKRVERLFERAEALVPGLES